MTDQSSREDPKDLLEVELTPAQREEAERRLREYEAGPGGCVSWEELRRRFENES